MRVLLDSAIVVPGLVLAFSVVLGGAILRTSFGALDLTHAAVGAGLVGIALAWQPRRLRQVSALLWRADAPRGGVWLLAVTTLLLTLAHVLRHVAGHTEWADVTFLHQVLFFPTLDPPLTCDVCLRGSYLAEHLSWTLYAFVPVTAALKSDVFVFVLGNGLVFAGTWLLIRYGPLRDAPRATLAFVLLVICERAFRNAMVWDFREDHLAYLLAALIALALHHGRLLLLFVPVTLYLLTKEHYGLATAFLAPVVYFDRQLPGTRRQKAVASTALLVLSLGVVVLNFTYLIPRFTDGAVDSQGITTRFARYGDSPSEILTTILFSPAAWPGIAATFVRRESVVYGLYLLLPFALMAPRHVLWLLPAIPLIAINVSSSAWTQRALEHHYELAFLPFLAYGLARGLADQARRAGAGGTAPRAVLVALLLALTVSGRWPAWSIREHWPTADERSARRELDALLASIPEDTTVGADPRTLPRLTRFRSLRMISLPAADSVPWTWQALEALNQRDATGLPGHSALNAPVWILDRRDLVRTLPPFRFDDAFGAYDVTAQGQYYLVLARPTS